MSEPVVYGADYSTYVRTVRMALIEKGVAYRLQTVDIFAGAGQTPEHLARQPFGKIPAFEHDGLSLFETSAIARYVDDNFEGPALLPADRVARARANQIVGVVDSYAYDAFVWKVFVERNAEAFLQRPTDEAAIAAAMPQVQKCVDVLDGLAGGGDTLCGNAVSLADCWLAPVVHYFIGTPEGARLIGATRKLSGWWKAMGERASVRDTVPAG